MRATDKPTLRVGLSGRRLTSVARQAAKRGLSRAWSRHARCQASLATCLRLSRRPVSTFEINIHPREERLLQSRPGWTKPEIVPGASGLPVRTRRQACLSFCGHGGGNGRKSKPWSGGKVGISRVLVRRPRRIRFAFRPARKPEWRQNKSGTRC